MRALERIPLDLSNVGEHREVFSRLGRGASKVLVITEGLLVYLSQEEVIASLVTSPRPTVSADGSPTWCRRGCYKSSRAT